MAEAMAEAMTAAGNRYLARLGAYFERQFAGAALIRVLRRIAERER